MRTPEQNFNIPRDPEKQEETPLDITGEVVQPIEKPRQTIEQIKQDLFDPKAISKKYDQEGRSEVASRISRKRQKSQIEQRVSGLSTIEAEKLTALKKRTGEVLVRLKGILRIKDKTADELEKDSASITSEIETLSGQLAELQQELADTPDPKKLLEAYYEKMETVPLTNGEKLELLKPEVLAELSTEEYTALWRRLNPHFLSHVTRQGFRDHNAMVYHSAGLQEFHSGLVSVLEDEKILRPPMAVRDRLRARDEASVRKFLEDWALKAENEEEAKKRLNAQLNHTWATAPNYPDKTAVHFAAQIVADDYYGGESNNEVFFLYPSDVLASQHHFAFNGWEKDFTKPQSETKWNDVFVWPLTLDNPGISVDSGVVFLPESTPVDPETGSKYASEMKIVEGEEKRVMVEDEKLVSAFIEWAKNLNDESPAIQAYKEYRGKENNRWAYQSDRERTFYNALQQEMSKLGFDAETALAIAHQLPLDNGFGAFMSNGTFVWGESTPEQAAREKLQSASANWKRAESTVSSKEYWEKYFVKDPQQKPKHLIFYNGDPTSAIYEFQRRNNIGKADVSETEGTLLGFDDHHVTEMGKDLRVNAGYDELVEMSHRIIEDHYRNTSK